MERRKIAVIGLGEFGSHLVKALYREGHEVVAVDREMSIVEEIQDFCSSAVCLDSTDERAMRSQGLEDMDAVILASADDFETLIVTTDILKNMGVRQIIARYKTDLHVRILAMMGITNIFNPEAQAANNMAERFGHTGIRSSTFVSEIHRVAEIDVPGSFVGVSLRNSRLKQDYNLNLVTLKRNRKTNRGETIEEIVGTPRGDHVFQPGDVLILFGSHDDIDRFLDANH